MDDISSWIDDETAPTGCERVYAVAVEVPGGVAERPPVALGRSDVFGYILEFKQEEESLRKESAASLKALASSMGLRCAPRSTRATLAKKIMERRYAAAAPSAAVERES